MLLLNVECVGLIIGQHIFLVAATSHVAARISIIGCQFFLYATSKLKRLSCPTLLVSTLAEKTNQASVKYHRHRQLVAAKFKQMPQKHNLFSFTSCRSNSLLRMCKPIRTPLRPPPPTDR